MQYDFTCLPLLRRGEVLRFAASGPIKHRVERLVVSALTVQGVRWEWETRLFRLKDEGRVIAARPDLWIPDLQLVLEIKESAPVYWHGREFATRQEELAVRCGYGFAYIVTGSYQWAQFRSPDSWATLVVSAMDQARLRAPEAKAHHPEWRTLRRFVRIERTHELILTRRTAT